MPRVLLLLGNAGEAIAASDREEALPEDIERSPTRQETHEDSHAIEDFVIIIVRRDVAKHAGDGR
jgi:hypothetical protein